jgi:hypothetical protein
MKVIYNSNRATGGTTPQDTTNYAQGDTIKVAGCNLVRGADIFAYWNTAANGSGTPLVPAGAGIQIGTTDITLFAQWYTAQGLTNGGLTTHYQFRYDSTLALEPARTNALLDGTEPPCESDYDVMSGWFPGVTLQPKPIPVSVTSLGLGGASWIGDAPDIHVELSPKSSDITPGMLRYILAAEITEVFMRGQNSGWFSADRGNESSCGEALSRFLAALLNAKQGLNVPLLEFAISPAWLNSSLPPNDPASTQITLPQLTQLTANISVTDVSIPVKFAISLPFLDSFIIQIESEEMMVISLDIPNHRYNVTRGYNGTSPTVHAKGTAVLQNYGSRGDYVNTTLEHDVDIDAATGCGMLFLYYLNVQLGFDIQDIVNAAPSPNKSRLRDVYRVLTGDSGDPFPRFKTLLGDKFPPNEEAHLPDDNPDNPFPLGSFTFWGVKSTWGRDEVQDIISRGGIYTPCWLSLEGLNLQGLGGATPTVPDVSFSNITFSPQLRSGSSNAVYETSNPKLPQQILFSYVIDFRQVNLNDFPGSGETAVLAGSSITVQGKKISALDEFFFAAGADPYFLNVLPNLADQTTPYFSEDLRVFTATPGLNGRPVRHGPDFGNDSMDAAYQYISSLIGWLNTEYGEYCFTTRARGSMTSNWVV